MDKCLIQKTDNAINSVEVEKTTTVSVVDLGIVNGLRSFRLQTAQGDKIGAMRVETRDGKNYVNAATILPEYRGQGIGTFMYEEVIDLLDGNLNPSDNISPDAQRVWDKIRSGKNLYSKLPTDVEITSMDELTPAQQETLNKRRKELSYNYSNSFLNGEKRLMGRVAVLDIINRDSPNKEIAQKIFDKLNEYRGTIDLRFTDNPFFRKSLGVMGAFDSQSRSITILDMATTDMVEKSILHEMIHYITQESIDINPEFETKLDDIRIELLNRIEGKPPYALKNPHELIAEFYTNDEFKEFLRGEVLIDDSKLTFFDRIYRLIRELLGFSTDKNIYERVEDVADYVFENSKDEFFKKINKNDSITTRKESNLAQELISIPSVTQVEALEAYSNIYEQDHQWQKTNC